MITKIVVFSDTHGSYESLEMILREQPQAALYAHLGDGYAQAMRLRGEHPLIPLLAVRGNCDMSVEDTDMKQCTLADKRILLTHGHRFDVKMGLGALKQEARRQNADIVLFGHTHRPFCEWIEERLYLNPGSAVTSSGWRYAVVEINDAGKITARLCTI